MHRPDAPMTTAALLEYVSTPGCSDCRAFEALLEQVRPDYPDIDVRAVPADSPRGLALSVGRGVLRFPVVVLDDEVVGVESMSEAELRALLAHDRPGAG